MGASIAAATLPARAQQVISQYYTIPLWVGRGSERRQIDAGTTEGYKAACWLLRDIRAGDIVGRVTLRTLYTVSWAQAWLAAHWELRPVDFLSGLRTPHTNETTEGAALASLHLPDKQMIFRAADWRIQGVPATYLADLARAGAGGGIGIYPWGEFIHNDDGRPHTWVGKPPSSRRHSPTGPTLPPADGGSILVLK